MKMTFRYGMDAQICFNVTVEGETEKECGDKADVAARKVRDEAASWSEPGDIDLPGPATQACVWPSDQEECQLLDTEETDEEEENEEW